MNEEAGIVNKKTIVWRDFEDSSKDLLENDPKYISLSEEEMNKELETLKSLKTLDSKDSLFKDSLKVLKARTGIDSQIKSKQQPQCRFFKTSGGYYIESSLIRTDEIDKTGRIFIPDEVSKFIQDMINDNDETLMYREISVKW